MSTKAVCDIICVCYKYFEPFMLGEWVCNSDNSIQMDFWLSDEWIYYRCRLPELGRLDDWRIWDGVIVGDGVELYKIDIIDVNTVNVYCYENGCTYTMTRT